MSIFQRVSDHLTGVLGRDCNGQPLRVGDIVEPAAWVPEHEIDTVARCQLIVLRLPNRQDIKKWGKPCALILTNPDGKKVAASEFNAVQKVNPGKPRISWEEVTKLTGWTPRTVEKPSEVSA